MKKFLLCLVMLACSMTCALAWVGMEMPKLHVEGRYLCDEKGNPVNLHGFGQTYSPWFNEQGKGWGWEKSPEKCLAYNKGLIDKIDKAGWKMQWLRLHMDPWWSNDDAKLNQWKAQHPGEDYGENHIEAFSETLFKKYLEEVFIPMAEYAKGYGLYVVMRPPGVCPQNLSVGDAYHQYLRKVWSIVCSHAKLKNNPAIMFELANEPINMNDGNGNYSSSSDGSQKKCTEFFQAIVDDIRALGCENILWVPGLAYQQNYQGYVKYPIKGDNLGFAVHCYPGWYGSDSEEASAEQQVVTKGNTYYDFQSGWNASLEEASQLRPILVTEMDWAPKKYNCSWGKATTGTLGGVGFGNNFKYIMDRTGNVSWMLFTGAEHLAKYDDSAADGNTFLTDPEACVRPIYRWFKEYADPSWKFEPTLEDKWQEYLEKQKLFPNWDSFNPNIWEKGSITNNADGTHTITTGQYGFAGWQFNSGMDMSGYKYLVVKFAQAPTSGGWSLRLFDNNNYWAPWPYMTACSNQSQVVVKLKEMYRSTDDNGGVDKNDPVDPSHVYILGFWSYGGAQLKIDKIYLTNNDDYSEETSALDEIFNTVQPQDSRFINLDGSVVKTFRSGGMYINNGKVLLIK